MFVKYKAHIIIMHHATCSQHYIAEQFFSLGVKQQSLSNSLEYKFNRNGW